MTHQSVILLATLLVMAAFSLGYWLGLVAEAAAPFVRIGWAVLRALYGMWMVERATHVLFEAAMAEGLLASAFADTEPSA